MQANIPLQVKGQARWLQNQLEQVTGKKYDINSSIVFIGWYVSDKKIEGINIVNAKNKTSIDIVDDILIQNENSQFLNVEEGFFQVQIHLWEYLIQSKKSLNLLIYLICPKDYLLYPTSF